MKELLDRIANALEANVALAKAQQADYRAAREEERTRFDKQRRDHARAQQKAEADATETLRLMQAQAERNELLLAQHQEELRRLRVRDEEQLLLLREAGVRSADSLDTFKVVTGLGAPDFVPNNLVPVPDDTEDDDIV